MYGALISQAVDFDGELFRNIKGIIESQDLFDDLGDALDQQVFIAAELRDKPPSHAPGITRPFDYGAAVAYPFLRENWQQTRYSDGTRFGVWYGSAQLETTIYETVHHWLRFVRDSFPADAARTGGERRVFKVNCQGVLLSLLGKEQDWPALVDPIDYTFTNQLGSYLQGQGQNGLLTPSARHAGGECAVIFRQDVLSNPRDVCYLSYRLDERTQTVAVMRGGETLLRVPATGAALH